MWTQIIGCITILWALAEHVKFQYFKCKANLIRTLVFNLIYFLCLTKLSSTRIMHHQNGEWFYKRWKGNDMGEWGRVETVIVKRLWQKDQGTKIVMRNMPSAWRKPCPQPVTWTGQRSNPSLRDKKPTTNILRHSTIHVYFDPTAVRKDICTGILI